MANIDSQISKIRTAERGEDVRDSIISALRDINNDVPADMSNPEELTFTMTAGSDIDHPINPPKLVSRIHVYQPNSGGKNTVLVDAKIVENGKYPSEDGDDGGGSYDPDKEIRYYKSVDVNVRQLANKVIDLEEEITQNGTYSAPADWGADGLRTFTVNVNPAPVGGQFEVEFYDKPITDPTAKVIRTELVPAYGSAVCTLLDGSSVGGQYFKGWNPPPSNVTKNMKCYPVYGDIIINPGEIGDGWDVICAKKGAGYPLLATKPLSFTIIVQPETVLGDALYYPASDPTKNQIIRVRAAESGGVQTICTVSCDMIKVAEGESGSTSTWISTGCIDFSVNTYASANYGVVNESGYVDSWSGGVNVGNHGSNMLVCNRSEWLDSVNYIACQDWGNCYMRSFLNSLFLANLPEPLVQNIKQVNKSYKGWSTLMYSASRIEKSSLDKIWIPSMKEFHTLMETYTAYTEDTYPNSPLSDVEEINGMDYSANYVPTWPSAAAPGWWVTRTMVSHSSGGALPMWMCANSSNQYYGSWQRWSGNTNNVPFGFCL